MKRALGCALVGLALAACAVFGPDERAAVATTAASIENCEEKGRACNADGGTHCYDVYDACMRDGGLR